MKRVLNNKGSALAFTLCILMFVVTVGASLLSASYNAHVSTIYSVDSKQAYFTARSAAAATIGYIQKNAGDPEKIENLTLAEGTVPGSIRDSMGDCRVSVSQTDANSLKILSTAVYKGRTSTVSAYLAKAAPAASPMDNLIYVNGSGVSGFGQCTLNGSVFVDGDFALGQGSKIDGNLIVKGNTTFTGAGATTKGLIGFGDVTMANSGTVNGDVRCTGSITTSGGSKITGSSICDGNLSMSSGNHQIAGDATVGGDVKFGGMNTYIGGWLKYRGSLSADGAYSYAGEGEEKIADYTPLDLSSYESSSLPAIDVPSASQNSQLYVPLATLNNDHKTVSTSGKMDKDFFLPSVKTLNYGSTFTVDTGAGDISLLLDSSYNVNRGICLEVTGPHNLYIYLTGDKTEFDLDANQYAGMRPRGADPKLYIIGSGNQSVNLTSNSELDAYIYLPNGSFKASGSPLTTSKFIGSCVAKSFDISSNVSFKYASPDLNGTPLEDLNGGSGWNVERWSDR